MCPHAVIVFVEGVFSPLADDQPSSRRSTNGGISPYLHSRHIPEGSVPEDISSHIASSQSHGSLSCHVRMDANLELRPHR